MNQAILEAYQNHDVNEILRHGYMATNMSMINRDRRITQKMETGMMLSIEEVKLLQKKAHSNDSAKLRLQAKLLKKRILQGQTDSS
jgi:hypothetical protein